jgi:hypothetical protein
MYHMRVAAAMLADAAYVGQEGKLYVHGGGWSRVFAPSFPVTHPMLAVVLLMEIDYHEALVDHELEVVLTRDGEPIGPRAVIRLNVGHAPGTAPGAPAQVPVALSFPMLSFDSPGRFEWDVIADGGPLTHVSMEVAVAPLPPGVVGPAASPS